MSLSKHRFILAGVGVIALCFALGAAFAASRTVRHTVPSASRAPIMIQSQASMEELSFTDLSKRASVVILGTVTTVHPSRWNTPDGQLSPGTTAQTIPVDAIIYTDVELRVDRVIKGSPDANVRVRTFGGQVGQDQMIVSSAPKFESGKQYVMFLESDTGSTASIEPGHYAILGLVQGTFTVEGTRATSQFGGTEMTLDALSTQVQQSR